ncbi:MAG: hypothetical protein KBG30_04940 [Bacteroidales bacterium]|nr:hypothetical protein [Bacteroidales bacterium]
MFITIENEKNTEELKGQLRLLINRSIENVLIPFNNETLIQFCLEQIKQDKRFSFNKGFPILRSVELADMAREELEWHILTKKKTVFVVAQKDLLKVFYPYPVSCERAFEFSMNTIRENYQRLKLNGKIFKDFNLISIFSLTNYKNFL